MTNGSVRMTEATPAAIVLAGGEGKRPAMLAVLPVSGVGWTDLGEPARVAATQRQLRWQPVPA